MQRAETSLIPDQNPEGKPVLTELVKISLDEKKIIYVTWPLERKDEVLVALAEAVKLVATHQPPIIIKPKPSILDFVRGIKH